MPHHEGDCGMEMTPELLERARKGRQASVVEILQTFYPAVYRLSHSLTGRNDVGAGVVKFIMQRSLKRLPKWQHEGDPERWFLHHTLLCARRASKHQPEIASDPLIQNAQTDNVYYPAFIRALRVLPIQQREAFILNHAERLTPRMMAVAMDCSTDAAAVHLREANNVLQQLAGKMFPAFAAQLAQAHARLTPPDDLILSNVRTRVRSYLVPRQILWWVMFVLKIAAIIGFIALILWLKPRLDY